MKRIYFLTGSQYLYGEEVLQKVNENSLKIVTFLKDSISNVEIVFKGVMKESDEIEEVINESNYDKECIGVIAWMHTFSPSKMWIRGLSKVTKPYLHLHTQINYELPYEDIDMDFMNLVQSAHGDREHAYILDRMHILHHIVVGHYKDLDVVNKIKKWIDICKGIDVSKKLNIVRFGDNMRDVAVTEGDKVEAQEKFGWSVNTYSNEELLKEIRSVEEDLIQQKYLNLISEYDLKTDNIDAVKEQIKYYYGIKNFLIKHSSQGFSNNFEDLTGLNQLPGLATQELMKEGFSFGAEGDWKIACLGAILNVVASSREGVTGFMEDYTYDFKNEVVLGAHMLEVSPLFASNKPSIEVHKLTMGNKNAPARLAFEGIYDKDAIACCLIHLKNRYRLIVSKIKLVKQEKRMDKLPVGHIMWKILPSFKTGIEAYLMAGGAHHTVISTALEVEDIKMLAKYLDVECVVIDESLNLDDFERNLKINELIYAK